MYKERCTVIDSDFRFIHVKEIAGETAVCAENRRDWD